MALTDQAHRLIEQHFIHKSKINKPKKVAIDATCGNGYDTEFLLRCNFDHIFAFDVQKKALNNTENRIKPNGAAKVTLIHAGHQAMEQFVTDPVDCIMFNFGYLPKGNQSITTRKDTSLAALTFATTTLSTTGLISLICYPGHPEGLRETTAIREWLATLDHHWHVNTTLAELPKPTAPMLFTLTKAP